MERKRIVTITIVEAAHAPLFYAGCVHCGKIVSEGSWALAHTEDEQHCFIGKYPREMCCGAELNIPFLFCDQFEARDKMREIMQAFKDGVGFKSYSFFPACFFFPEKVH